eukprot:7019-Heterococcus_DN1.PRE.10
MSATAEYSVNSTGCLCHCVLQAALRWYPLIRNSREGNIWHVLLDTNHALTASRTAVTVRRNAFTVAVETAHAAHSAKAGLSVVISAAASLACFRQTVPTA